MHGKEGEYLKDTLMDGELVVDKGQNANTKVTQSIYLSVRGETSFDTNDLLW